MSCAWGELPAILVTALLLCAGHPIVSSAVAGENPSGANPLAGTHWTLSDLGGKEPAADATVTLSFAADGTVGGSNGCNQYTGSYEITGSALRFPSEFAATLMACPEPAMAQADSFMQALKRTATFELDDAKLRLLDGGAAELARFAAQGENVVGTSWKVTGYNNGRQAVVSVLIGTEITARFGEDGRLTGTSGCNEYSASYEIDGEGIEIGPAGATRRFCAEPEGTMEQERRYLEALQSAATFRTAGEKLELRTAEGALAVTLVP
jgi:heat shock protein HslJ